MIKKFNEKQVTPSILRHMDHQEDLLYYGKDGAQMLLDTIEDTFSFLKSDIPEHGSKITQKVDGCVSPSSLIKTDKGIISIFEAIEKITSGETLLVEGFNESLSIDTLTEILGCSSKKGSKKWVCLTLENNNKLFCTEDHPIYTLNRGYVEAINLTEEDILKD